LRREHERADQDRNRYRKQRDRLQDKIDRLEDDLNTICCRASHTWAMATYTNAKLESFVSRQLAVIERPAEVWVCSTQEVVAPKS
jgi:hypothetical protein